jgi:UDP-glucose 4-epimerase
VAAQGLTVAVTGPTGDLGIAVVSALERSRSVTRIVGMARRPFDPTEQGWRKTEYREGDVQDESSVKDVVKGADVVVHLAFSLMGEGDRTRAINVDGSRRVFEAAVTARAQRICYASSVAAYGFHEDNPVWLTEDVPARGTPEHFYSGQKAEVERVLAETLLRKRRTVAYVFRPCIVAGPRAQMLLEEMPYFRLSDAMPAAVGRLLSSMPILKPVIPDPGLRFQLVHEDDVASAFVAGVQGKGEPGPYNLAGTGTLTMSDLAAELGWYSVPVPDLAVDTAAEVVSRLPRAPESVSWIHAARRPVLMKVDRARKQLGWKPRHSSRATLEQLVAARRAAAPVLR